MLPPCTLLDSVLLRRVSRLFVAPLSVLIALAPVVLVLPLLLSTLLLIVPVLPLLLRALSLAVLVLALLLLLSSLLLLIGLALPQPLLGLLLVLALLLS